MNFKCKECGDQIKPDDCSYAEVGTRHGKPIWGDVCHDCYYQIAKTCQLCGRDDVMPSETSDFILCKNELASTANRPPGIYRVLRYPFMICSILGGGSLTHYDVLFIDKLPKRDSSYEISGHICDKCSEPYQTTMRRVYRRCSITRLYRGLLSAGRKWRGRRTEYVWNLQKEHIRNTCIANPDMLRDLECEKEDHSDFDDLRELFDIPLYLPTWHEWLVLEHRGVKVFGTSEDCQYGDGWLLLKPEPRYRWYAYGGFGDREPGVLFTASSLPTYPHWDYDAPENKGKYHSTYDWDRQHSIPAIKKAIEQGYIKQNGTFDKNGTPCVYG